MADENNGSDKLVYFLIGAGIGAVTALLFAPKPGSREAVTDLNVRSRETVNEIAERGKDLVNRQKSQIQAALEAGKQGYMEAKQSDQAKAAFEDNA